MSRSDCRCPMCRGILLSDFAEAWGWSRRKVQRVAKAEGWRYNVVAGKRYYEPDDAWDSPTVQAFLRSL